MWGELRRVLVRRPLPEDAASWKAYGWRARLDVADGAGRARGVLSGCSRSRAEVVVSEHDPGNPDAIYTYDPTLVGRDGAVLLQPGKAGRRTEPEATCAALEAGRRAGRRRGSTCPATVEGGDTVWLDGATLLVGHRVPHESRVASTRCAARFPGVEVIAFDLPHWNGAGEVMHLMTVISPLDRDLALVYPRIAPTRLMWLLAERGIEIVEVPDEEFESMGPNVLALGPRRALALEGNPETRRLMERAGVDVAHLSRATRSRARATAARPASRVRCSECRTGSSGSRRAPRRSAGASAVSPETPTPTSRSAPGRSRSPRSSSRQARSAIRSGSSIGVGSVVERERIEKSV